MNCYGPDQNYDLLKGNKRYRAKPNAGHTYEHDKNRCVMDMNIFLKYILNFGHSEIHIV